MSSWSQSIVQCILVVHILEYPLEVLLYVMNMFQPQKIHCVVYIPSLYAYSSGLCEWCIYVLTDILYSKVNFHNEFLTTVYEAAKCPYTDDLKGPMLNLKALEKHKVNPRQVTVQHCIIPPQRQDRYANSFQPYSQVSKMGGSFY